jgi:hypothetical protein
VTRKPAIIFAICTAAAFVFIFLVALTGPLWQWSWFNDLPQTEAVRQEPARPILKLGDVRNGSAFDLLQQAANARAKIATPTNFTTEIRKLNLIPWEETTFPAVSKVLEESRGALALAERASTVPNPQMPSYTSPLDTYPYLIPVMQLERLWPASAAKKVTVRDFAGAFTDLNTAIDVADLLSRGSPLIHCMSEMACEITNLTAMRLIALQNNIPLPVLKATTRHLIAVDKNMEPWAEAYREDYRAVPSAVSMCFDPSAPLSFATQANLGVDEHALRIESRYLGWLVGSLPKLTLEHLSRDNLALISLAERPYNAQSLRALDAVFRRPLKPSLWWTTRDPLGYYLGKIASSDISGIPGTSLTNLFVRHYWSITELRATEAVLAIREFEIANNYLPKSLNDLIPDYLPSMPIDPFDGKPLRYKKVGGNAWAVYSVGANQIDDGGIGGHARPVSYDAPGDIVYSSNEAEEMRELNSRPR